MSKITVLGGCGTVGSAAVRELVKSEDFSEILVADIEAQKAEDFVRELGSDMGCSAYVDATDPESLREVIEGSSVVLNCIGPFYEFAPPILSAAIENGVNYVDICDDFDATERLLEMDGDAKEAGVSALIGMGSSPGVANLLAKYGSEQLLDETEEIHIYHAHGGEPVEGPAVVKHRIHSMESKIPVFTDGELIEVGLFSEEGKALEEEVEFPEPLGNCNVYPYPHPETITLPRYIEGVRKVTNKGIVLPESYSNLVKGLVKLGVTKDESINVRGVEVSSLDFSVSYILSKREQFLEEGDFGEQKGSLKIVLKGKKEDKPREYHFSLMSVGKGMGEGTGIPAAIGARLMDKGEIEQKGIMPPEACVDPMAFLNLAKGEGKLKGSPLIIEEIDEEGNVNKIEL